MVQINGKKIIIVCQYLEENRADLSKKYYKKVKSAIKDYLKSAYENKIVEITPIEDDVTNELQKSSGKLSKLEADNKKQEYAAMKWLTKKNIEKATLNTKKLETSLEKITCIKFITLDATVEQISSMPDDLTRIDHWCKESSED